MSDKSPVTAQAVLDGQETAQDLVVAIEERTGIGVIDLRMARSLATEKAIRSVFSLELVGMRRFVENEKSRMIGIAPDRWWVFCAYPQREEYMGKLRNGLGKAHHMLTDVSHLRCILRLAGAATSQILAKYSPVDFSPEGFAPGEFRLTHCNHIACGYAKISKEPEAFEMMVARSYAQYIHKILSLAARPEAMIGLVERNIAPGF